MHQIQAFAERVQTLFTEMRCVGLTPERKADMRSIILAFTDGYTRAIVDMSPDRPASKLSDDDLLGIDKANGTDLP